MRATVSRANGPCGPLAPPRSPQIEAQPPGYTNLFIVPRAPIPGAAAMGEIDRPTLAIGLLSASLLAYLVHLVLQWRRLSHVPGPFWAAISKGWMVRESLKGRQPISFKEANDKYGALCAPQLFVRTDN